MGASSAHCFSCPLPARGQDQVADARSILHRARQRGRGDCYDTLSALVVDAGVSGHRAHANVLLTSVTLARTV